METDIFKTIDTLVKKANEISNKLENGGIDPTEGLEILETISAKLNEARDIFNEALDPEFPPTE